MIKRKHADNPLLDRAIQIEQDEERELVHRYKEGDADAGQRLIDSQIAWIVNRLSKHTLPKCVEFDDLLMETVVILLDAIRKSFDPNKSKLSTFVSYVVQRRARRIIRKLMGSVKSSEQQPLETIAAIDQLDVRMDELADAVWLSGLKPSAMRAVELHLAGYKTCAIFERLREEFPDISDRCNVNRLIDNSLETIRACARKLGSEVPDDVALQGELFGSL